MRIGVFGGTFDPPHAGHMALAQAALEQLNLDEVIWMPANRNPLRKIRATASTKDRLEMIKILLKDQPEMAVSDLEILKGGPSYAVDTLTDLTYAAPGDYWFLVGADALKDLPQWKQPERLLRLCRLGVVLRPPTTAEDVARRLPPHWQSKLDIIQMKPLEVSSTEIRAWFAKGRSTAQLLDPRVLDYIRQHGLYK